MRLMEWAARDEGCGGGGVVRLRLRRGRKKGREMGGKWAMHACVWIEVSWEI